MKNSKKIRLALLCGGRSDEREVSLAGASEIIKALDPGRYAIRTYDTKTDLTDLVRDAHELDAAFILLHGRYGEDGTVQGLLELLDIPYQGSEVLGSALAMDKHLCKTIYRHADIPTPAWRVLRKGDEFDSKDIVREIGRPVMVKPAAQGSSVGMNKAAGPEEIDGAVKKAFEYDRRVLVEAFIPGREITAGVLGLEDLEALPLVEICPGERHDFFDYEAKYQPGAAGEICPADLPDDITRRAQEIALSAHKALQLRGYSRTDMILSEQGGLYALETNTIPGMTPTSLFPLAAKVAGIPFGELLDRLIDMALDSRA